MGLVKKPHLAQTKIKSKNIGCAMSELFLLNKTMYDVDWYLFLQPFPFTVSVQTFVISGNFKLTKWLVKGKGGVL